MSEETKLEPTKGEPDPTSEEAPEAPRDADLEAPREIADLQSEPEPPEPEAPESPHALPGHPLAFRHLSRGGKALRVVIVLALAVHLGAMFLGGAIAPVRKFFSPVIGFYAEGLRMSNSWGMFGKPPSSTNVSVAAVLKDGTLVSLSTTDAAKRTLWERIRDVRIRKILGKLGDEGERGRLGPPFMDYFCKEAKERFGEVREIRATNDVHETRDDDGKITRAASSSVVVTRPCIPVRGQPPRRPPASVRKPQPSEDRSNPGGGDL